MADVFSGRYAADVDGDFVVFLGLLHARSAWLGGPAVVQYWRSFEHLDRYARNADNLHIRAWKKWNGRSRKSGAVGIWHETYKVRAGEYEAIYGNMPRVGLALAGGHVPLRMKGRSAARRIGAAEEDIPAIAYPG